MLTSTLLAIYRSGALDAAEFGVFRPCLSLACHAACSRKLSE